jgi:penicillin V acylase-like amidase (Ntn superfamily)
LAYVPSGTSINRARTLSTAPSPPTNHGFVCISGEAVGARVDAGYGNSQPGFCMDGLNQAGLSASYLWQERNEASSHAGYADDFATDKLTVSYWDLLAFVLGTCDTIDCVVNFFQTVPVITTSELQKFSLSRFGTPWVPVHAIFADKTGASVVIEWSATKGNPVINYENVPAGGVATNGGTYTYLQSLTDAVLAQSSATFGTAYGGNLVQTGYPGGLIWGSQISPSSPVAATLVNGQLPLSLQNSASRFVRTSMLRDLVGPVKWGKAGNPLSPEAYGTMTAAAMQADGLMNSAAIPAQFPQCMPACVPGQSPEAEGSNVYSGQDEATLIRTLRDHKRGVYFIRTAYNPTYHRIDLEKYLALVPPKVATIVALTKAIGGTWWNDMPLPGA